MAVSMHFNVKVDTSKVRIYNFPAKDRHDAVKTVILKMHYGDSEILNPESAKVLNETGCNIISIEVVYTDYKKQDIQDLINRKRLMELYFIAPNAFTQSMTQWKYVEQLGYASEDDARKLFHGLVIKYIKIPVYSPVSVKSMLAEVRSPNPHDTSYFTVLRRNIKFRDELVCVDLTGSMSPYYIQVFQWLYMNNSSKQLNFAFFNDGDSLPDHLKRVGDVGGVYLFKTNSIDTLTKHAYRCISGGYGGDAPENNIESIIKGVKKIPECKEIVMLVDNWADMRDYSLMAEVKLPVRVIICGTNYQGVKSPVNPQYLDLAKKTGGSVYTMEEDLADLAKKKEGEEITVEGMSYVIRGGRFIRK